MLNDFVHQNQIFIQSNDNNNINIYTWNWLTKKKKKYCVGLCILEILYKIKKIIYIKHKKKL